MHEQFDYIYQTQVRNMDPYKEKRKVKSIPVQAWGFQEVESPRFHDSRHKEGGNVASPTHRPPLLPRKYSW
jgi:hypothetical protein